ncbi:MAG: c-type cytochrome [Cyclobacteriaceae bacterium]
MKNLYRLFFLSLSLASCKNETTYSDEIYTKPNIDSNPVLESLSPEESIKRFHLPKGFKVELVASEPMISEPVSISWDGNGRMYVSQMNTYMQDADAIHENEPWSKISLLDDTNNDGTMDKSTVFIDSLVLPRIVLPLDERVIVGETYKRNLYSYRDSNGDGIADEKMLLLEDTVRDNRNLEHQDANMLWSIENWLYVTNQTFRYRFENNQLLKDTLQEPMIGQWGLTQDETGRIFLSRAGAEIPALGFQQHPSYGNLTIEKQWDSTFLEPWPIVGTSDAQGGVRRVRPGDSTLNRFTGVAGQEIYLGDKMPGAYGDLFIPEPVGRLVRRAKVSHVDGTIVLENRYHQTEFLASTDPLFRPVFAATGPDGCLYIVDMYRGIIQEGTWVKEGSYLRGVVNKRGLDKFYQRGRIYRIYHEKMKPGPKPDLLGKSSSDLLPYLSHPNGWWRMTAQKLIILKNDLSVVDNLKDVISGNENFLRKLFQQNKDYGLERLHALWTLEGLRAVDRKVLKISLNDKDPRVKIAAIRIGESFLKKGDQEIFEFLKTLANDPDPEVAQQLILSLRIRHYDTKALVKKIEQKFPDNELIKLTASENLNPFFAEVQALREKYKLMGGDAANQIINGHKIFNDHCAACHGTDGKGIEQLGPSLVGSPRLKGDVKNTIKILLHGLTGPVDGKEFNGPMASVAQYNDIEIANIVSYIREHLNGSGTVWRGEVGRVREQFKDRKNYWTLKELSASKN